jgi:hypothetical protein
MGIFEEMMQQYQDSHKIGGAKKSDNKYDLKNYFNAGLPKGVDELKKKIRILPPEEGKKTSFGVMYGHTKKINGEYKTFPCLKHEKNEECPFCQAREALLAGGTEEEKELANKAIKLQEFMSTDTFIQPSDGNQYLLEKQLEVMTEYINILGTRIELNINN